MPADEIEPEGVERADPNLRSLVRRSGADTFGQFAGGAVGEGQNKDGSGIDSFLKQGENALDQRLRFACSRTGLELKRRAAMRSGAILRRVRPGRAGEGAFGVFVRRRGGGRSITSRICWRTSGTGKSSCFGDV